VWPFWIKDKFFAPARNRTPPDCPAHSPITTPTISQPTIATIMTNRKERRSKLYVHHTVRRFWPFEFYGRRCKHQPSVVSHTQACALFTASFMKITAVSVQLAVWMSRHHWHANEFSRSTPAPTDGRQDHRGHTKSLPSSFLTKGHNGKDRHHRV